MGGWARRGASRAQGLPPPRAELAQAGGLLETALTGGDLRPPSPCRTGAGTARRRATWISTTLR